MSTLVTGASGFAGRWLAEMCVAAGEEVLGVSRSGAVPAGARGRALDLADARAVRGLVAEARPDVVYHLAALSSVGRSWQDPARTVNDNVAGSVAVLEAIRHEVPGARVVWVSTCEIYGPPTRLPLTEEDRVNPVSPYAVSKAAGDQLAGVYAAAYGLHIVRARPFSHAGPGQRDIFLLSSLARQAAEARRAGADSLTLTTGNPQTRRDFTDVRDVVRAYRLLAERAAPGVYNVCSGASVSAAEQVALLGEVIAPMPLEHTVDPAKVRAHEIHDLRGDHGRLTEATGWEPRITLRETMRDTVAWWEEQLRPPA